MGKKKTLDTLKRGQAIAPEKRNYFGKDWYNQKFFSRRSAISAYNVAKRNYKAKLEKLKKNK